MRRTPEREFDVLLWGATGFTGRLLAQSMAVGAPAGLRWGIAGRDPTRLASLARELGVDVGLVVGDADDPRSMQALARRTRVVASTVGPYARYGTPLVAACVSAATGYADITGETVWMRRTIEAFDAAARAGGTRIVHACGFDSVPSDLGVWLLQRASWARHGRPCSSVRHVFGPMAGGVSGGTVASLLAWVADAAADADVRRALADPDLLVPGAERAAGSSDLDGSNPWWPQHDTDVDAWTARFPMAHVNERVVRRTRALLGEPWGDDFRYRERWLAGPWWKAAAVDVAASLGPALLAVGPVRRFAASRWLPQPGEGPSSVARATGYFRSRLLGRLAGVSEPVVVTIEADLDPGYGATALMLREAVLALSLDEAEGPAGVVTPAATFGGRLVERLAPAGVRFRVEPPIGVPGEAHPS